MDMRQEFKRARIINSLYSDSTGEYVLPDYNTDIKKILLTQAKAVPSGAYVGDDSLECSGIVNYKMVYVDSENEVTHLEFSTDYDFSVRCDAESYISSQVDTRVAGFTLRLMGPRRIVAKATLNSRVSISEKCEICVGGDAFELGEPECQRENISVRGATHYTLDEREYADEICSIEGAVADEVEILYIDADVKDAAIEKNADGARIKGTVEIKALIKNGSEAPYQITREISISEPLGEDMGAEGTSVRVNITSLSAEMNAEEDGVSVVASLITECSLITEENETVAVMTDCYLKERGVENEFIPLSYSKLVSTKRVSDSSGFEVHRSACSAERVRNFICCTADLRNEKASATDTGAKIEAEIRFSAIACEVSEEGELSFSSVKLDFPYSKDVNLDCHFDENMRLECNSEVTSSDIELEGDMIYPKCTVSTYLSVLREESVSALSSSSLTDETYTKEKSCVKVYFPKEKDTLFDIAKRYHTTVSRIASVNSLTEECIASPSAELSGIKRLIIK